jgi:DNA topoisomerase-6 subunit B
MNIVWIDDTVTYEKGRQRVKVQIYKYTPQATDVPLHTVIPK